MKKFTLVLVAAVGLVATQYAAAQITVLNSAGGAPQPFVAVTGSPGTVTPGSSITISSAAPVPAVGTGCASRVLANANQSFIPCGSAVNPVAGWCLQFWLYRTAGQQANGNPDYVFADAGSISPTGSGAFRCFFNGAAGLGNIFLRGVPNQVLTATAPILLNTWVHVAFKYEPPPSNVIKCLINGAVVLTVAQTAATYNWVGTGLSICGGNNSSASAAAYFMDDIRLYGFARTDADIAGDYTVAAAGNGPSGLANLPDRAYFDLEGSVQPHFAKVGTNSDPTTTGARIATGNTVIEWDAETPAGDLPTSCLINIHGVSLGNPALDPYTNAYRAAPTIPIPYATPFLPGVEVGHGYSTPANPLAIAWPDGLGLNIFPGLLLFAVPGLYTTASSPSVLFVLPPNLLSTGDHIDMQWMTPDPAYPLSLANTNVTGFLISDCATNNPGNHVHVEARGTGAIQVSGFWEIWNTGTGDITQVVIDTSTCVANGGTATGFSTTGFLNSGGTPAAGNSYRFQTEIFSGLANLPPGFTGIAPGATAGSFGALQFDFTNFTNCIDEFIFDSDSVPSNINGNAYIGATVTVTFADTTVLTGLMVADPTPGVTNAAIINL